MEDLSLLVHMSVVLGSSLAGGFLAHRIGLPVIMGYLISGVVIGPHALGLVSDVSDVETLATIGVALLMFTLGAELSLAVLRKVSRITILAGVGQVLGTTMIGFFIGRILDLNTTESILFGFFAALSSTLIVLKTLYDRGELGSPHGRIMTGILIIQDLSVVPMMAIIPSLGASGVELLEDIGWSILKAAIFLLAIFLLGIWVFPRLMKIAAARGSRELFLLMVVCICLGTSYASFHFGLSIALGAFMAGLLVSESDYTAQALTDIKPLRDLFAILFFGSLGMLANPRFVAEHPAEVAIAVTSVIIGKFVVTACVPWIMGYGAKINLFTGSGLLQIGEFSFVLAAISLEEDLISDDLYSLTLVTAFITILLTPFAMGLTSRAYYRFTQSKEPFTDQASVDSDADDQGLANHVVICGYGWVARHLSMVLEQRGFSYVVIDIDPNAIGWAQRRGISYIYGDASHPEVLARARLDKARVLVVAFPDPIATRLVVRNARKLNRRLDIVARVYGDEETQVLKEFGVSELVRGELEAGLEIIRHTLTRFGLSAPEIQIILNRMREDETGG